MTYSRPLCHNLFDWADTRERAATQTPYASHIQRHYHVSPIRARLIAEQMQGDAHEKP
jgi:hypothetical protein